MRPASQRRLLQVHRDKILCVELRGELFFGSSQQVLQQVSNPARHTRTAQYPRVFGGADLARLQQYLQGWRTQGCSVEPSSKVTSCERSRAISPAVGSASFVLPSASMEWLYVVHAAIGDYSWPRYQPPPTSWWGRLES